MASEASTRLDSSDGKQQVSRYSFEQHWKVSQIRVLDVESGASTLLVDDLGCSEPVWVGEDEVLYLKGGDKGTTRLVVANISHPEKSYVFCLTGKVPPLAV